MGTNPGHTIVNAERSQLSYAGKSSRQKRLPLSVGRHLLTFRPLLLRRGLNSRQCSSLGGASALPLSFPPREVSRHQLDTPRSILPLLELLESFRAGVVVAVLLHPHGADDGEEGGEEKKRNTQHGSILQRGKAAGKRFYRENRRKVYGLGHQCSKEEAEAVYCRL